MLSHKEEVKANAMKFRCQLCGLNLKETTALTEHLALHARAEKYQCVLCYKIMISKKSLERHIRTDHVRNLTFLLLYTHNHIFDVSLRRKK